MILNAKSFKNAVESAKRFIGKDNVFTNGVYISDSAIMATDLNIFYKEKIDNMGGDDCPAAFLDDEAIKKILEYLKVIKKDKSDFVFDVVGRDVLIDGVPTYKMFDDNAKTLMPIFPYEDNKTQYSCSISNKKIGTLFFNDPELRAAVKEGFYESRNLMHNYPAFIYLKNDKAVWTNGHILQEISTGLSDIDVLIPVDIFLKYKKFDSGFSLSYYTEKEVTFVEISIDNVIKIAYRIIASKVKYLSYDSISDVIAGAESNTPVEYQKDELLKQAILSKRKGKVNQSTIKLKVETEVNFDYLNFILSYFDDKVTILSEDDNKYGAICFKDKSRKFVLMPLR